MAFFLTLLFYIGAFLVTELLRPKPDIENARPSDLGDFSAPTAQEGRVVPVGWGTIQQRGPNVIWFGDLEAEAITEKVKTGLFSSERITTGFRYSIGMQFGLMKGAFSETNGHDGIRRIWVDDKQIRTDGTGSPNPTVSAIAAGDISIDKPNFNGEDSNLIGTLEIVPGSATQAINSYLAAVVTDGFDALPAYRGTAYAVYKGGEIGQSPSLAPWKFEITRIPNGLGLSGSPNMATIFEDGLPHANPMNVLYEIMTDTEWGAGVSPAAIDTANFITQAEKLWAENNGFSMLLDNPKRIGDVIQEIERQVDGVLILNESTELYEFLLARENTDSPDLTPLLDESNAITVEMTRTSWEDTINEVRVPYIDPTKEYGDSNAIAGDMANERIQGSASTSTIRFPGCKQGSLANILSWRELRLLAYPLSKLTIRADRSFVELKPTDLLDVTWGPLGLDTVRYRVNKLDLGDMENGIVVIDAVEDIFQTEISTFGDPITSRWTPFSADPVQPAYGKLIELPLPMQTASGTQAAILVGRGNSFQTGYDVYMSLDAGGSPSNNTSDADFTFEMVNSEFTPVALLVGAMDRDYPWEQDGHGSPPLGSPPGRDIVIDGGIDLDLVIAAGEAALSDITKTNIRNFVLIDDEWIFYERLIDNLDGTYTIRGIYRGMMDSIPAAHADDAVVWFATIGIGRLPADNDAFPLTDTSVAVRVSSSTPAKTMSLANSSEMSLEFAHKSRGEAPPADPFMNDIRIFDLGNPSSPETVTCGTLQYEMRGRNLVEQQTNGPNTTQSDPDIAPEGGAGYVVDIYRTDTSPEVLVYRRTGIAHAGDAVSPAGTLFNVDPDSYTVFDGSPLTLVKQYRTDVYTRKLGFDSQAWQSQEFQITGYGLDYGESYGGICNPGVNLAQGDPPIVVEPVPGTGQLRRWLITIGGTVGGAADDHHFFGFYFDALEGTSGFFNIDINGALYTTPEEVATFVSGELTSTLPGTFTVDRVGGEITVATEFGTFTVDPAFGNGDLSTRYGSLLQEEERGVQGTTNRGVYGSDFFDTALVNGVNVDVLGPSVSTAYSLNGTYRHEIAVRGLTYAARKALDFGQLSADGVANVAVGESALSYAFIQNDLLASLQGSVIAAVSSNISSGFPTDGDRVPDRGPVATVTLLDNFVAYSGGQVYQQAEPQPSIPYRLVWKEINIPQVYAPSGLARTYWFAGVGTAPQHGMLFEVEYNGSIIATHTVGSPLSTFNEINADLAAQIDAHAALSSEVLSANNRVEVQGALQTNYDLQFYVGLGLRIKFEEIT